MLFLQNEKMWFQSESLSRFFPDLIYIGFPVTHLETDLYASVFPFLFTSIRSKNTLNQVRFQMRDIKSSEISNERHVKWKVNPKVKITDEFIIKSGAQLRFTTIIYFNDDLCYKSLVWSWNNVNLVSRSMFFSNMNEW